VIGGAELICKKVSESLAKRGHEIHVVTTDVGAVQAYYEFGIAPVAEGATSIGGVAVRRLEFSRGLYRAGGWANANLRPRGLAQRVAGRTRQFLHKRLEWQITKEICRIRPDVVMTMPHLVVNVLAVLSARSSVDFPLVMVPMLHEHDPNWNVGVMAAALSSAGAVIVLTGHEADRLTEAYGIARQKIFLASVGIEVDAASLLESDRPKRVLFLGRQVKSKGIGDLIEAMRLIWPQHPDAELCIAGVRVPESSEVDAQIAALPERWRSQVNGFGVVSDVEKAGLLRSSRCLVLPSKTESFGMVILEAWAHATPAITWDLPVFRSIVEDEETGLLADPEDGPKSLANAIMRLLSAPDEAARIGTAGYRKAAGRYAWSNVASVYLDAYDFAIRGQN
jgi:glycosyltransferase involved in cell wall biosynthesis